MTALRVLAEPCVLIGTCGLGDWLVKSGFKGHIVFHDLAVT